MNRLRKAGYCFKNIPREDKKGGDTGIIYSHRYNPSLVSKGRQVTMADKNRNKNGEYSHSI